MFRLFYSIRKAPNNKTGKRQKKLRAVVLMNVYINTSTKWLKPNKLKSNNTRDVNDDDCDYDEFATSATNKYIENTTRCDAKKLFFFLNVYKHICIYSLLLRAREQRNASAHEMEI